MAPFLVHLHKILTSDPGLTALIPSKSIGASVRQPANHQSLEWSLAAEEADHAGHCDMTIHFRAYSKAGAEEAFKVMERVKTLMTAKNLTPEPPGNVFKVVQCRLANHSTQPQATGGSYVLRAVYDLRVSDLRPRLQKQ